MRVRDGWAMAGLWLSAPASNLNTFINTPRPVTRRRPVLIYYWPLTTAACSPRSATQLQSPEDITWLTAGGLHGRPLHQQAAVPAITKHQRLARRLCKVSVNRLPDTVTPASQHTAVTLSCRYWGLNDSFCCTLHIVDSQCLSMWDGKPQTALIHRVSGVWSTHVMHNSLGP